MGFSIIGEGAGADAVRGSGGVVVGRGFAGRGARAAGRSRGARSAAERSRVVGADHGAVRAGAGGGTVGDRGWAADDRDGDLRALDGAQAALPLGVPDAGRRGVGLDPSAAVLPGLAV